MPRIVLWSWVVLGLLAAHDLTHVLDEGLDTPAAQLAVVAIPQWLFLAGAMAVVLRGDPARRRAAALVLAISVALGFTFVHLLPFSPAAYWDLRPAVASWALVWVTTLAALVLAALAWPQRQRAAAISDAISSGASR